MPAAAVWRRGLGWWRTDAGRLFLLALAAEYAGLLPELGQRLGPPVLGGEGARWLLLIGGALLEAWIYAVVIARLAHAGGIRSRAPGFRAAAALTVADLLYSLAVFVGLLILFVPGLIISIRWLFFPFTAVVEGSGPIAALEDSGALTRGRFWRVSAMIAMPFLVYSIYAVLTWMPMLVGLRPLLAAAGQPGASLLSVASHIAPPATAMPLWYFLINPLLGAVAVPAVLAMLAAAYKALIEGDR